jgi:hypothetical protein
MIEFHTLIPERNFPLPSSLETPHTEPWLQESAMLWLVFGDRNSLVTISTPYC